MTRYMKRCQSAILSAALALTMLPAPLAKAADLSAPLPAAASEAIEDTALLADFDFNADPQESKFTSKDTVATVEGTGVTLQERDASQGKALYLDGNAGYLDLKKSDGSSLLTGLKEFTISFEAKPDRTSTNWGFYIAPNADRQGTNGEHYLGALINGGTTTLERYHQTGSRPRSASAATGTDWAHVDAVYTATDTTIYVDGIKMSTEASNFPLTDILGDNSIFQIGKANWGAGEYTKGWIDNFKVYSKALSESEIQSVPNEAYKNTVLDKQAAKVVPVTIQSETATLPDYNHTVTWKSNMEAITIAEDGLTATVAQPAVGEEPLTGKLIAVVNAYGSQKEVEIAVTVKPQAGQNDAYGYMMVHFIEDSNGYAEKIYLDISRGDNPEQWDPLNGGQPILASNLGKTGSRDPFLTYNPETETYYILGTDLRVFGGDNAGWGAWSTNYSTKMNIWESKDLIHWSDVRQFDVARNIEGEKVANLGMMWAPEATWVPDYYGEGKGAFVVYWSSQCFKDEAQTQPDSGSKIMWGATTDFTQETWEYGGVFLEGGTKGWIDTTIIQNGNKTYHITKSHAEEIIMESTTDKEWWKPETNWTRIQSNIGQSRFGSVEGPAVFKDHSNDSRWYLFVDDLPTPGYQPMISTNLDNGWDYLDSPDYFLTQFTKHGGVISLTKQQYDAIRKADAVSLAENEVESVRVTAGAQEADILSALPTAAKVNLAYNMGENELPVTWDLSQVNTEQVGKYEAVGTVDSIGANKNQWVGKDGSTSYLAEDKKLYSSTALQIKAEVRVVSGQTEPGKADKSILQLTIAKADALAADQAKYTEQSWSKLQEALTQAKNVMAKADASQDEADQAESALDAAILALRKAPIAGSMASFDFEDEAQDGKFTSNDVVAAITGTAVLQERDAQNGKALYLDGSASWLSLAKADGSSLLTGLEEVTISFDAKPDRTGTNWGFYAAPNANAQEGGKEHYIGALINGGNTTIERYNNTNGRPNSASAVTGTDWSHVDVVFTKNATALYVNGKKQAVQESSYALSEILGTNSIFQIGKANWSSGEYYKGWIDNFVIYGTALSDDQLIDQDVAAEAVRADLAAINIAAQAEKDFTLPLTGAQGSSIAWSSSNEDYIKIENGKAIVNQPKDADQKVTLTATASMGSVTDKKAFEVTVIKEAPQVVEVTEVALNKGSMSLKVGETETLTVTVVPENATDPAVTWESSNAAIAEVDSNGKVTAKAAGEATITVKAKNGKAANCVVTVTEAEKPPVADVEVSSVTLNRTTLSLVTGKSQKLTATVAPANATNQALTWESDNVKVATVDQNGNVKAIKAGTANVTVKAANGKSAVCKVTVKIPTVAVKTVKLSLTKATLGVKEKLTLKATVKPANATNPKVTWKSDKTGVATVNAKGVVTAKKPGTAKITATAGGKKATCKITVKKAPSKITLNASKKALKKNKTFQIKVKLPKNTASNKITYSSSNKKVATVSSSGKIKAVKKGTATITVKAFNGKKAKIKVTVR